MLSSLHPWLLLALVRGRPRLEFILVAKVGSISNWNQASGVSRALESLGFEGGSERKEEAPSSWELALPSGRKDGPGTSPLHVE